MPSFKSAAIAFGIVFVVLLVIALLRRSRFGDPVERVAALVMPGVGDASPPGAAT
jgi:hypothetical protein